MTPSRSLSVEIEHLLLRKVGRSHPPTEVGYHKSRWVTAAISKSFINSPAAEAEYSGSSEYSSTISHRGVSHHDLDGGGDRRRRGPTTSSTAVAIETAKRSVSTTSTRVARTTRTVESAISPEMGTSVHGRTTCPTQPSQARVRESRHARQRSGASSPERPPSSGSTALRNSRATAVIPMGEFSENLLTAAKLLEQKRGDLDGHVDLHNHAGEVVDPHHWTAPRSSRVASRSATTTRRSPSKTPASVVRRRRSSGLTRRRTPSRTGTPRGSLTSSVSRRRTSRLISSHCTRG